MNNIKSLIGNTLYKIVASIHFEDKNNQNFSPNDIMDICLIFEKISITVSTNSDGETIDINFGNQLKEIDMNKYGFIGIRDISEILNAYKELIVTDINILTNEHSIEFGIELILGKEKIIIENIGDQLFVNI